MPDSAQERKTESRDWRLIAANSRKTVFWVVLLTVVSARHGNCMLNSTGGQNSAATLSHNWSLVGRPAKQTEALD
jgi:hypothetical protein